MNNINAVIENFNDNHNIRDVIETCTGEQIKGKSLCCPIHGGDNKNGSSINEGKNIFSCWTNDCGKSLSPWLFIKKYYGLQGFKEVAEKVNILFNANIPIYEKGIDADPVEEVNNFDESFKVNKYLSECKDLKTLLQQHKHLLLNANTGLGKTFGIVDLHKDNTNDYVFFLVPTRALAEGVAKEYGYEIFYGDDTEFPNSKYIVSTYNKIDAINRNIFKENEYRSLLNQHLVTYSVVVDEVHEIMSKRRILGSITREIEAFIIDSDDSILMSANTIDVYEAYNGLNLFNRYISVESAERLYNSDKTYIYRIPRKVKQKNALLLDKIIENLSTHSNILLMEDSKNNLEEYSKILSANGIENIVINSDNKNDDEILEEYNSIVQDNKLKRIVVLCTSLINAGVNIQNNNTCTMVIQDKMQFDTNKIEQIFGRLRSDKGNTCILFLFQGEKNKFRSNKKHYINYYTELANMKAMALNQYYLNKFGFETVEGDISTDWNLYKENEGYREVKDCIYLNNGVFKIDNISIYEKARLEWLRNNYYDDELIQQLLRNLKTREIKVITLTPIEGLTYECLADEVEDHKETLNTLLSNLIQDIDSLKEFYRYIRGDIKPKYFINEMNVTLYNNFKGNKLYKEMIKCLKYINSKLSYIDDAAPISIFTNIMLQYIVEQKAKDRNESIDNIKRVEIYNKQFPLGSDCEDIKTIGDNIYYIVRKNCDCFISNRNKINKTACKSMYDDYITINKCVYKEGQWHDKKGKKIRSETIQTLLNNCIREIYACSDNLHLYSLK